MRLVFGTSGMPELFWEFGVYLKTGDHRVRFTPREAIVLAGLMSHFRLLSPLGSAPPPDPRPRLTGWSHAANHTESV